jgi:hypothetical protein
LPKEVVDFHKGEEVWNGLWPGGTVSGHGPGSPGEVLCPRWLEKPARGWIVEAGTSASSCPLQGLSPAFGQPEGCTAAGLSSLNPRKSLRNREPFTDANQTFDCRLTLTVGTKAASSRGASPGLDFCADYAAGALPSGTLGLAPRQAAPRREGRIAEGWARSGVGDRR